jgi:putative RNA 2'-phosphotransferase
MSDQKSDTRVSKFLSLVLRHQPEVIGIIPDENGWVSVQDLLEKMKAKGIDLDFATLKRIVLTNDKKRFAFNEDSSWIRASQGHSIKVELGYSERKPPEVLYHGTAEKNREIILAQGLKKGSRHHVHLSIDIETAIKVGARHGAPVVFEVMAEAMQSEGYVFFVSDNGVWLTDTVPAKFLKMAERDNRQH